jgi:hypothetical protein
MKEAAHARNLLFLYLIIGNAYAQILKQDIIIDSENSIMGYNYGARNTDRMRKILKAGFLTATGTEIILMMIYCIFA